MTYTAGLDRSLESMRDMGLPDKFIEILRPVAASDYGVTRVSG
jgi:hypothetical protein